MSFNPRATNRLHAVSLVSLESGLQALNSFSSLTSSGFQLAFLAQGHSDSHFLTSVHVWAVAVAAMPTVIHSATANHLLITHLLWAPRALEAHGIGIGVDQSRSPAT